MGKEKGGFLSPKAIANRIKSKGLQKLRWFCQMCQKQCRDENGFKCHLTSESHQRQLLLFAENPDQYIDTFSEEFKDTFLELLKRRFGTKRVHSNIIYQEYISDREHTHMNSTQWETLTEFVKWLGREGLAEVDQTEKGWFIKYIDRSPDALKKLEANEKKEKMNMDDEEKTAQFIKQQIERAAATAREVEKTEFTELQRENEEEKVVFSLGASVAKKPLDTKSSTLSTNPLKKSKLSEDDDAQKDISSSSKGSLGLEKSTTATGKKRKNALDEIMEMEEKKKEKINRKDFWVCKGIVVKIVAKKLGEKYYKRKGYIKDVQDQYLAVIKMLDSGDKLKIDQAHLETVIPAVGKAVMIVNGAYRGTEAILTHMNEKKFTCTVKISSGPLNGRLVEDMQYEDISKIHTS